MPRAKNRVASRARRKKILSRASGYYGKKSNCITMATDMQYRSGNHAYAGRKQKKRNFRSLWVVRINAAARSHGTTYGKFICALKTKGIELDRKSLANLALHEPSAFKVIIDTVAA